jgi:hypothetical protein
LKLEIGGGVLVRVYLAMEDALDERERRDLRTGGEFNLIIIQKASRVLKWRPLEPLADTGRAWEPYAALLKSRGLARRD